MKIAIAVLVFVLLLILFGKYGAIAIVAACFGFFVGRKVDDLW